MTFLDLRRQKHTQMRQLSRGADISLVSTCGTWQAMFECASKCEKVLKGLGHTLQNGGEIPTYDIPTEQIHKALTLLSEHHSVALLDQVPTDGVMLTRWALVWVVQRKSQQPHPDVDGPGEEDGTWAKGHEERMSWDRTRSEPVAEEPASHDPMDDPAF